MILARLLNTPLEMLALAVLAVIGFILAMRSLIHAARTRADAFEITGRLSKTAWVAILAASSISLALTAASAGGALITLSIIAWVFVGVYWGSKRFEINNVLDNAQS